MVSRTKQLTEARERGDIQNIRSKLRKINRQTRARIRGESSITEEDIDRIIDDYMDDDFKIRVINERTGEQAIESLENGQARYGRTSDFENFISGATKRKMVDRILDRFQEENILKILNTFEEIKLKTKSIQGIPYNNKIYLRQTKVGLRAFRFKDNRFAKIPLEFKKRRRE